MQLQPQDMMCDKWPIFLPSPHIRPWPQGVYAVALHVHACERLWVMAKAAAAADDDDDDDVFLYVYFYCVFANLYIADIFL